MPNLTVRRYPTPLGVESGELMLRRLAEQGAITVHDADPEVVGPAPARGEAELIRAEVDDETVEELRRPIDPGTAPEFGRA
ncbi:MAG TPA: hypothetical protein VFT70_15195 [Nocardioides sp.]|nr:hypothetical protein [Nocardioides sp.]